MQAVAAAAVAWGAFLIWEGTRPWDSQPNTTDPCTIWVWAAASPLPHTRPHRLQTDLTFTNAFPHFPNVFFSPSPLFEWQLQLLLSSNASSFAGVSIRPQKACFWNIQDGYVCEAPSSEGAWKHDRTQHSLTHLKSLCLLLLHSFLCQGIGNPRRSD